MIPTRCNDTDDDDTDDDDTDDDTDNDTDGIFKSAETPRHLAVRKKYPTGADRLIFTTEL